MTNIVTTETVRLNAIDLLERSAADPVLSGQLDGVNQERWGAAEDMRNLRAITLYLPELPEATASEVYERICEQERRASPRLLVAGYGTGTAAYEDELAIFGHGPLILEAQHATDPFRKKSGMREGADHGTAGLVGVMALEGLGRAIIPLGRQSSNATGTEWHPLRDRVAETLDAGSYSGFISFHGMKPGKVVGLRDSTEIHAILGLGADPREQTVAAAEKLVQAAHDQLGLRVQIGNNVPHLNFAKDPNWDGKSFRDLGNELELHSDGLPAVGRMASTMAKHMVAYVNGITADTPGFRVAQLELSRSLRKTPEDMWVRERGAEVMGVYLGYELCKLAAELFSA